MTDVLWDWVRDYAGVKATCEEDFGNGYKLGELLARYNQQLDFPVGFADTDLIEDKIQNFSTLQPSFKNLGIQFHPHDAEAIMNNKRGAVLRLLYQVKMVIDRIAMTQRGGIPGAHRNEHLIVKEPKFLTHNFRLPKPKHDSQDSRFFVSRLRAQCAYATQQRREARYNKFEREKMAQQILAQELDKLDAERALEDREGHRKVLLDTMKRNRAFLDEWHEQDMRDWQENIQRQRMRESMERSFKTRMVQKQRQTILSVKENKNKEVHRGIANFEENLKKFTDSNEVDMREDDGLDGGDALLLKTTRNITNGNELYAELNKHVPAQDVLAEEASQFLDKIKKSKVAGNLARKEREKRRRRFLVDLQTEQESIQEEYLTQHLTQQLTRPCLEEERINYNVWKGAQYEPVMRENRRLRMKEYDTMRKVDKMVEKDRDNALKDRLVEELYCVTQQYNAEHYRALERGRLARKRAYHVSCIENIVTNALVDLMHAANKQQQITDSEEPDARVWTDWMQKFIAATPSGNDPTKSENLHDAKPYEITFDTAPPKLPEDYNVDLGAGDPFLNDLLHLEGAFLSYIEATDEWDFPRELPNGDWQTETENILKGLDLKSMDEAQQEEAKMEATIAAQRSTKFGYLDDEELVAIKDFAEHITSDSDYRGEGLPGVDITGGVGTKDKLSTNGSKSSLSIANDNSTPSSSSRMTKRKANFRLACIVRETIMALYPEPEQIIAPEDPPPKVPLRIILTGKPLCGKSTIARKLADDFDLQIMNPETVLHEALAYAGRPEAGTLDELHVNKHTNAEHIASNKYLQQLQEIGVKCVELLDNGETVTPELYVKMILAKLKHLKDDMTAGWVLLGFPTTLEEMQIFELELCGYKEVSQRKETEASKRKKVVEVLAPTYVTPPEVYVPEIGGYDVYALLESSCENSVLRSAGRRIDLTTNTVYNVADDQQKKPKDIKYENLRALDVRQKSQGTFVERMHYFDVHQVEVLDFLSLFAPFPDQPKIKRQIICPEASIEDMYTLIKKRVTYIQARKQAEKQGVDPSTIIPEEFLNEEEVEKDEEEDKGDGPDEKKAAEGADATEEGNRKEEEIVFKALKIPDIVTQISKMEKRHLQVVHNEWLDIQYPYITQIKMCLKRYEQHLTETRNGLGAIRERFTRFLEQVNPARQELLDEYITSYNQWIAEYPHMILDDSPKSEFHLRLNALRQKLAEFRDQKSAETDKFIEDIKQSDFIQDLLNIVAVLTQQLIATETEKYHKTCQLLCDFYKLIGDENLVQAVDVPEKPNFIPEGGEWSARQWQEEQELETGEIEPGTYTFPVLDQLKEYAQGCVWKLTSQPSDRPPPPADPKKGAPPPEEFPPEPLKPHWVDYQQSILTERILFLERVSQIHMWAYRRLKEICKIEDVTFSNFKDMMKAREFREGVVESEILGLLHSKIESSKPMEFKIVLDNTQLQIVKDIRIFPENKPPPVKAKKSGVLPEWNAPEIQNKVNTFFDSF